MLLNGIVMGFDSVEGLTFDSVSNLLFGTDTGSKQLIVIDPLSGAGSAVGSSGFAVLGLTFIRHVGDMNCDGLFDTNDIAPFILSLLDSQMYIEAFPGCNINLADINLDFSRDGRDIQGFVNLLLE